MAKKKHPITWILVADARNARVYKRGYLEKHIPAADETAPDLVVNALVQVPDMTLDIRALEASEEQAMQRFAHVIALKLSKAKAQRLFHRLVLVAPPNMLGMLHEKLSASVLKSLIAELPKDISTFRRGARVAHLNHSA